MKKLNKNKTLRVMRYSFIFLSFVLTFLCSCNSNKTIITNVNSAAIPLDISTNVYADANYLQYLEPIKKQLDEQMNVVIGYAPESMIKQRPECSLTNFACEAYLATAENFLGQKIDIAINNFGGLRTNIAAGNVTNRTIYELMPFDNQLVIVWLKGSYLKELIEFYALVKGEGLLGIRFTIKNQKAQNITVNGKEIDPDYIYSIVTNDYCAAGNDGMFALAKYEKIIDTGYTVRDITLNYVKTLTAKGKPVSAAVDGRISIEQ
jgi:2',3'-cyclic-nucleotide 2'-phosphodiesterase (5'-nucleotidase family)